MGFSRQEHWSGWAFPTPGDLPDPGIELMFPPLAGGLFNHSPPWEVRATSLGPANSHFWASPGELERAEAWREPGGPQSTKALRFPGARQPWGWGTVATEQTWSPSRAPQTEGKTMRPEKETPWSPVARLCLSLGIPTCRRHLFKGFSGKPLKEASRAEGEECLLTSLTGTERRLPPSGSCPGHSDTHRWPQHDSEYAPGDRRKAVMGDSLFPIRVPGHPLSRWDTLYRTPGRQRYPELEWTLSRCV